MVIKVILIGREPQMCRHWLSTNSSNLDGDFLLLFASNTTKIRKQNASQRGGIGFWQSAILYYLTIVRAPEDNRGVVKKSVKYAGQSTGSVISLLRRFLSILRACICVEAASQDWSATLQSLTFWKGNWSWKWHGVPVQLERHLQGFGGRGGQHSDSPRIHRRQKGIMVSL